MKITKKLALLLLILSLLLTPFTPVSAVEEAQSDTTEVTRVCEVESLRETNSVTYLMSDGTYQCVIYTEDKYYNDGTDTLKLIDNTIKAADTSTLSNPIYTNTAGFFDVTFGASGTPNVTIALNENSISFSPLGASGGIGNHLVADDHAVLIGKVDNNDALDHLTDTGSNTITYSNAFAGVDLIYVLANQGLKEYIVLNSSSSHNAFSFLFELDGLTMQTVDGFTHFVNENEETVFTLGSLFAVDANGEPTDALTYDFVPVKGNADQMIVTVTLDNDYLTDPDRAFPVVIDPTVMISSSQTADTCVCEGFPSTNYYMATSLRTGYDVDYGKRRSYLKFNIPSSIPAGSVTAARIEMEKVSGAVPTVRAYRVTGAWTSSSLTWANQPGYATNSQTATCTPYSSTSNWYVINTTSIVKDWINGNAVNYGFIVMDNTEDNPNHWTTWYSSDADSPHKPELYITYTDNNSYQYRHYYDNTMEVSQILPVANVASTALFNQFGIYFTSSSPSNLTTLTQACPLGASVRCSSACSPNHHKDAFRNAGILHSMTNSSNERIVYWTNHGLGTYCVHDSETGTCSLLNGGGEIFAGVYQNSARRAIQFFHICNSSTDMELYCAVMGITLIHETAHSFGMPEVYNFGNVTTHSATGYQCVMESYQNNAHTKLFYDKIKRGEEPPFCTFCAAQLEDILP